MAGLTLDTGALIAFDRGSRRAATIVKDALRADADITIPAAVLAQAWRGPRNARIAMLLQSCVVEVMDKELARAAGSLCGRSGTSDVIDAVVVIGAAVRHDTIVTSDGRDIAHLRRLVPGVRGVMEV